MIMEEFYKTFNKNVISLQFFMIFLGNVLCNIDHGTLPGCSQQIKDDIKINDLQFGTLGSVVYGGIVIGSLCCSVVFSNAKLIKPCIVLTLGLNGVALFGFTLTKSFTLDAFLRLAIGFFQVFICIYMPVWADTFARDEKQKSAWITFLILATPLGIVIGFSISSLFVQRGQPWQYSFYL